MLDWEQEREKVIKSKNEWLGTALRQEALESLKTVATFQCSDAEYEERIAPYWSRFGRRPDKMWFEYYGSRDGVINPAFIPDDIYFCELIPYLNNLQFKSAIQDKCYFDQMLSDVKQPLTVCRRISGEYFDADMKLIDESKAVMLCLDEKDELFIKPSLYSAKGHGIDVFQPKDIQPGDLKELFDKSGHNFIVQQKIIQHPDIASLCSDAVSTIRVVSIFLESKVHIISSSLRVGESGVKVVGLENGGYITEITDEGKLFRKALSKDFTWVDGYERGLYSEEFTLPAMEKVYSVIRDIHPRLSHFKILGWDFSVDETSEPVLIEFNIVPGFLTSQLSVCKPIFGDFTQWILDDYFFERKLEKNQRQGLLYQ